MSHIPTLLTANRLGVHLGVAPYGAVPCSICLSETGVECTHTRYFACLTRQ